MTHILLISFSKDDSFIRFNLIHNNRIRASQRLGLLRCLTSSTPWGTKSTVLVARFMYAYKHVFANEKRIFVVLVEFVSGFFKTQLVKFITLYEISLRVIRYELVMRLEDSRLFHDTSGNRAHADIRGRRAHISRSVR